MVKLDRVVLSGIVCGINLMVASDDQMGRGDGVWDGVFLFLFFLLARGWIEHHQIICDDIISQMMMMMMMM